jgi:hypothetical protein
MADRTQAQKTPITSPTFVVVIAAFSVVVPSVATLSIGRVLCNSQKVINLKLL